MKKVKSTNTKNIASKKIVLKYILAITKIKKDYLYCKDHKLRNMVNIYKNHISCKKHDISHSKNSKCDSCKLDLNNFDKSSKYLKEEIIKDYDEKNLKLYVTFVIN